MALKQVIKISVNPEAKKVIAGFAQKLDMTEIGIASRVYTWFAAQDDVVRKGVLNLLPEGYELDLVELVLKRLAGEKPKGRGK